MRGGYRHIPFVNVFDNMDVEAFFGSSPCAMVNYDKPPKEREDACDREANCIYDAKVHLCQSFKNAYKQVLQDREEFLSPRVVSRAHASYDVVLNELSDLIAEDPDAAAELIQELDTLGRQTSNVQLRQLARTAKQMWNKLYL